MSEDGYILTNTHVIRDAKTITVTFSNGKKLNAVITRASPDRDLAVIKVNAQGLPVPKFGDSAKLRLGQMAIAIGNPLRFSWTVTTGCVSALNRDIKAKGILYRDLIQTDAAINPGSSGGALVNSKGEVIGINTLVFTGGTKYQHVAGLSFAIPINEARRTADYLIKGKQAAVPKPWIGINGVDVTEDVAEAYDLPVKTGVLVDSVVAFGPAAKAGIEPGDILTEMNGQLVRSVEGLKALLNTTRPGEQIEFMVWHQGRKSRVKVTVEQLSQ
jgi:serine protease Do